MRRAATVLVLIAIGFSESASADVRAMDLLRTWVTAVLQHTPGEEDEAARSIAAWSREDLERAERYIQTLIEFSLSDSKPRLTKSVKEMLPDLQAIRALAKTVRLQSSSEFPKRAALLHTDIVMLLGWTENRLSDRTVIAMRTNRTTSSRPNIRVLAPDGRLAGYQLANPHWDVARSALGAIPLDDDVKRWLHMVAAYFEWNQAYADLAAHMQFATAMAPEDPWVLFDSACHQEVLASPAVQDFVHQATLPAGMMFQGMTTPGGHWQRAENLFRHALAVNPDFPEAQLRLGRVLDLRERHAEAIVELDRVDAQAVSPSVKYFANLFRGNAQHALGKNDLARANYEMAVALYPRAQAARMALGHLLRESGDRNAAQTVLEPTLSAPAPRSKEDDPWWDYHRCEGPFVEQLFGDVVAPFVKEKGQ